MQTGSSVNTLNPQCTEITLLGFTVTVCILQTFFNRVFGYGQNITARTPITLCELEDFFPSGF
jgi:hypothetical protein